MKIEIKEIGKNQIREQFKILDQIVKDNFKILIEGAVRQGMTIYEDGYGNAQISRCGNVLHQDDGLLQAGGFDFREYGSPTEEHLSSAIALIQDLLDEAAKEISCGIKIQVIKG